MQLELESRHYKIIYLDTFKYSSTSNKHYGWTLKRDNEYIFNSTDSFDKRFMIAFTNVSIVDVISPAESNKSIMFKHFIKKFLSHIGPKHLIIMNHVFMHKVHAFNNSEMTKN